MLALLTMVAALGFAPAAVAQVTDKAKGAARIESDCGLKKGTLTIHGESVWLSPSQDEAYERIDCALAQLRTGGLGKFGFVGNEADPNAVLRPPLRYIAEGSSVQVTALVSAARADKWVITRTATASDGTAIAQFESGPTMTNGQASKLLDRVWKNEFGDIGFGFAPRKLSDRSPNEE